MQPQKQVQHVRAFPSAKEVLPHVCYVVEHLDPEIDPFCTDRQTWAEHLQVSLGYCYDTTRPAGEEWLPILFLDAQA